MSENNSHITYYPVPTNVSARFEFFQGFGWYELKWVAIGLAIGGLLFFLSGLFTTTTLVEPGDLTFEQTIGLEEGDLVLNDEGLVVMKSEAIPFMIRMLILIVPGTIAFFLVKREPSSNMSLIYSLKSAIEFKKKQRRFIYKYKSGSEG